MRKFLIGAAVVGAIVGSAWWLNVDQDAWKLQATEVAAAAVAIGLLANSIGSLRKKAVESPEGEHAHLGHTIAIIVGTALLGWSPFLPEISSKVHDNVQQWTGDWEVDLSRIFVKNGVVHQSDDFIQED